MTRCETTVWWWDCDMHARCVQPAGHDGPHRDGTRWFTSDGLQTPRPAAALTGDAPAGGLGHPRGCGCAYHEQQRAYQRRYAAKRAARRAARLVGAR